MWQSVMHPYCGYGSGLRVTGKYVVRGIDGGVKKGQGVLGRARVCSGVLIGYTSQGGVVCQSHKGTPQIMVWEEVYDMGHGLERRGGGGS